MTYEFMAGPSEGAFERRTYFIVSSEEGIVEIRRGLDAVFVPMKHLRGFFTNHLRRKIIEALNEMNDQEMLTMLGTDDE